MHWLFYQLNAQLGWLYYLSISIPHFLYVAAFYFITHWTLILSLFPLGKALYNGYSIITAIFNWFLHVICLIVVIFFYAKIDHVFFTKASYLCCLLRNWFLTIKKHPFNFKSSYIPNSSLFQTTVYPVGMYKVQPLFTQINACISVKVCCVVTKIGNRICLYTPYQCSKFQQDQSTRLRVRANFVICAKRWRKKMKNKNWNFGLSYLGNTWRNFLQF